MKWNTPIEVTDADIVFPSDVVGRFLPEWNEIPVEFKNRHNKFCEIANSWFFNGLKGVVFVPKDGIDQNKALRQVKVCLGSFQPSHEHKEAGCAYLLSLFFNDIH